MEDWRQLFKDALMLLIGGATTFIVQHFRRPSVLKDEHAERQQGLVERQTKTLDDAFKLIEELQEARKEDETERQALVERIKKLEEDNRKFRNAYARAIRYIYEKDPTGTIPDFLLDTNPKVMPKK